MLSQCLLPATVLLALNHLGLAQPASPSTPMQQTGHFTHTTTQSIDLKYLLFLPRDYATQTDSRFPLLLFLHGAGERGTDVQKVAVHGPPKIVQSRPDFPFVVVSPQCPAGQTWSADAVIALLDHVLATHRIDTNRVYLTGLSMGGFGSWSLAMRHPERFAAVAPICGGGLMIEILQGGSESAAARRNLPIWAFHGAKDTVVPLTESERMVDIFRTRAGNQNVKLTVYPEAGHDAWTETYKNEELYRWLLSHTRPTKSSK